MKLICERCGKEQTDIVAIIINNEILELCDICYNKQKEVKKDRRI